MANPFARLIRFFRDEPQPSLLAALPAPSSGIADVVVPKLPAELPPASRVIARPPVIDRFPIQIGQNLTGTYVSSAYRLCVQGWRYQFVDLLNELFDYDPHARAVVRQRVTPVAGGRVSVNAAKLPPKHPDEKLAAEIAENFDQQFSNIPSRTQSLSQLNWGVIYGLGAAENIWEHTASRSRIAPSGSDSEWELAGLSHIHSRRLNYPHPENWELYIWDQGSVGPGADYMGPTTGAWGLRVSSLPGKFAVHAPALNGDYPTRDGEGRYIGMYMLLKRMVVRATAQDFERTIRPWVVAYFNRDADSDGNPPAALPEDETAAFNAAKSLGNGSLNAVSLPNTVKIEILRAASAMNANDFVSFLNREMAKCMLGQSFTTEPGANGNLATAEIAKVGTLEILRYDARALADTIERDIAWPWMQLNYPQASRRLMPRVEIHVDELPDPKQVADIMDIATKNDIPVDIDEVAPMIGLPVLAADDSTGRRTRSVSAGKGPTPPGGEETASDDEQAAKAKAASAAGQSNGQAKPNGKTKGGDRAEPAEEN